MKRKRSVPLSNTRDGYLYLIIKIRIVEVNENTVRGFKGLHLTMTNNISANTAFIDGLIIGWFQKSLTFSPNIYKFKGLLILSKYSFGVFKGIIMSPFSLFICEK